MAAKKTKTKRAKTTIKNSGTSRKKAPHNTLNGLHKGSWELEKKNPHKSFYDSYIKGHGYYFGSLISLALFFLVIVQAAYTHVKEMNIQLAALYYFIAVLLLAITRRCYHRGKGHYRYL